MDEMLENIIFTTSSGNVLPLLASFSSSEKNTWNPGMDKAVSFGFSQLLVFPALSSVAHISASACDLLTYLFISHTHTCTTHTQSKSSWKFTSFFMHFYFNMHNFPKWNFPSPVPLEQRFPNLFGLPTPFQETKTPLPSTPCQVNYRQSSFCTGVMFWTLIRVRSYAHMCDCASFGHT